MHALKKTKTIFRKVIRLLEYFKFTRNSHNFATNQAYAVINLDSFLLNTDMGRFAFILAQLLKFSDFKIIIKLNKRFFFREAPYKELLLLQDYIRLRKINTPVNTIQLFNNKGVHKTIKLLYGYKFIHDKVQQAWFFPFPLHPSNYKLHLKKETLKAHRKTERRMRVFFAGNTDSTLYNNDSIRQNFSMIPRFEIVSFMKDKYAVNERVLFVDDEALLYDLIETGQAVNKAIVSEARTSPEKWLEVLSSSNFFICLPGVRMPSSHNAVEAMSVGTIPIIQYAALFDPPLEHMKTCIIYQSIEEYDLAIETALNMDEAMLKEIKENVINYYDQYLSTEAVVSNIYKFLDSQHDELELVIPFLEDRNSKKKPSLIERFLTE